MKKKLWKILGIAGVFVVSLVVGLTGAWFTASREATGIIRVGNGIVLTYTNMKDESGSGAGPFYLLFNDQTASTVGAGTVEGMYPGESVTVKAVSVGLDTGSADAILRFKYQYAYRIGNEGAYTAMSSGDENWHIATALGANTTFAKIGDWYYYCTEAGVTKATAEFAKMKKLSTGAISLQGTNNTIALAGTAPANYQIQVTLVIEALQATSAAYSATGNWATQIAAVV